MPILKHAVFAHAAFALVALLLAGCVEYDGSLVDKKLAGYSQTTDAITNGVPAPNDSSVVLNFTSWTRTALAACAPALESAAASY